MSTHLHSIYLTAGSAGDPGQVPPRIALNLESFKLQHPAFTHTLYGNESGRDFIRRHFDGATLEAYDELVPLAYKADLLRYCLLYERGGIYADLSLNFFAPLVEQPSAERLSVFRDGFSAAPWIVSNSLLYAPARERLFEQCILSIIEHTRLRYYGINQLCPTGPNLLGRHLATTVPLHRLTCGETVRINKNPTTFSWAYVGQDHEVVAVNVKQGGGLRSLGGPGNDYNQLYAARTIYRSEQSKVIRWSAEEYARRGFISSQGSGPSFPAGVALKGPFVSLAPGSYRATFHVRKATPRAYDPLDYNIDVCSSHGANTLLSSPPRRAFPATTGSSLDAEFRLINPLDAVEVRLVLRKSGAFHFDSLEIERL